MAHRSLSILRRRLFTVLSILSLLLCLATLALWVRSYWRMDMLEYTKLNIPTGTSDWFISNYGTLVIRHLEFDAIMNTVLRGR